MRELTVGGKEIVHLNDGSLRIDYAKVHHRTDFHRDIIARDHVLAGYIHHDSAQVNSYHFLDAGNYQDQARTFYLVEAAKHEYDASFIFPQDAKYCKQHDENDDKGPKPEAVIHKGLLFHLTFTPLGELATTNRQTEGYFSAEVTCKTRPSIPVTRTFCP